MKKSLITGFFIFLLTFTAAIIAPLVFMTEYAGRTAMDRMEKLAPLLPEQKFIYFNLLGSSEERFIAVGFYIFLIAFLASLFLGSKILKAIKDLQTAADAVNGGKPAAAVPLPSDGELRDIARAFNSLMLALGQKDAELQRKNHYMGMMVDALWVINDENLVVEINPAFTRLLGYEPEDVLNYRVFEFVDEEGEKILRKHLLGCAQGHSSSCELRLISKPGSLKPVTISWSPIFGEEGEVTECLGILRDFMKETELRSALKEALDYQRAIMDSMPEKLIVLDQDLRIVMANKAASDAAPGGLTGKQCHWAYGYEDCTAADCPVKKVLSTGGPQSEIIGRIAGGRQVHHEVIAYPVENVQGAVRHVVVVFRDITEKRRFEAEIKKKNTELGSLLDISKTLNQSLKSEEVFGPVIEKLLALMGMDGGCVFLLDEMGPELSLKYSKGLSAGFLEENKTFTTGQDIPGKVAGTGRIFTTADLTADTRTEASAFRHTGMKACLATPMQGNEKVNGVIMLFSFAGREWTEMDEDLIGGAGQAAGMALENIRRYEKMRQLFTHLKWRRDEERKKVAQVAAAVAGISDPDRMLDSLLVILQDLMRSDFIWLLERDETKGLVVRSAPGGGISRGLAPYEKNVRGLEADALEKGGILTAIGENAEAAFTVPPCLEAGRYKAACAIPVPVGEGGGQPPKWAIGMYFRRFRQPGPEDLSFLRMMADILHMALEKARLHKEASLGKSMAGAILDSIEDGIIAVDPHGSVTAINRTAAVMAGTTGAEAMGRVFTGLFKDNAENARLNLLLIEGLTESLKGRHQYRELAMMTANGMLLPIVLASYPVLDEGGEGGSEGGGVAGVVFALRDLTRNQEITRLKNEFVRAVSQEFKDPVSAILGMSEMLMDGEAPAGKEALYLKAILSEGRQIERIMTDYLNLAEIDGGPERLRLSPLDMGKLIADVVREFGPAAARRGIGIGLEIKGGLRPVEGDAAKLKYILRNLLENAITYSGENGSVRIEAAMDADAIALTVKDTGWGIPEADRPHMGEKFYRGSLSGDTKGTGLGLSLSKQIVQMHGGTINIDSIAGEGTTIRLRLPLRRQPGEQNNGD